MILNEDRGIWSYRENYASDKNINDQSIIEINSLQIM